MDLKKLSERAAAFYKDHKKWSLIGGGVMAVIIIAAILFTSIGRSGVNETQVVFLEVTTGPITETIDVVGSLEAVPSITLAWESGGIVGPIDLQVGDVVEKGQVLMTLEDSSLASSILQAQTDLLDAQAALENLKISNTDLHTAAQNLADLEYALIDYKADRDYYNSKNTSWDAIYQARDEYYTKEQIVWEKETAYDALSDLEADDPERLAAYEERKAAIEESDKYLHYLSNLLGTYYDHAVETDFIEYDQALGDVEQARNEYNRYLDQTDEIAAAEANVQALQNTIDQARIVAPFTGTVTEIAAVSGELVTNGTSAIRIDNLDNLMVDIFVSEVDINSVAVGQPAILTFDALTGQEYSGIVDSISSAGSDDSGVVEFRVTVKVDEADESVKPGFTSVVSIITSQVENALLVPTQAILTQGGLPVVMRANKDGSSTAVPVELGATSDTNTQVISGDIALGDQLAVTIASSQNDSNGFDPSAMREINQATGSGPGGGQRPE
jgi:HlyD family secretion protein